MIKDIFKEKKIFITGMGTIGSEILKQVLTYNIHSVRVFDNSEIKLHNIKQKYGSDKRVKIIFGDIRDRDRLKIAMRGVDIVFHTAAMKHVSICERNPIDTIKTNVIGTQNIIDIAIEDGVERLINISTDKATNPIGVMGASKLLSEKLIASANYYKGSNPIVLSSVRFGNVFGSSGSVVTIFEDQIKNGNSITITDNGMVRYMMSKKDAIKLILKATELSIGGEIFILKMSSLKIIDLATEMCNYFKKYPKIEIVGKIIGERLNEKLISDINMEDSLENENMMVVCPTELKSYYKDIGFRELTNIQDNLLLNRDQVMNMIKEYYETKD
jgi:FlaA1/EpsC-like NDP-sugar epimerase